MQVVMNWAVSVCIAHAPTAPVGMTISAPCGLQRDKYILLGTSAIY